MKQWMIWLGAGVVGIAVAFLLVPWGQLGAPSVPDIEMPDSPAVTTRPVPEHVADPAPTNPSRVQAAAEPTTGIPSERPAVDDSDASTTGNISAARQRFNERRNEPDIKLATTSDIRWQGALQEISVKPHDPAADHALERVRSLRTRMSEYTRDPSSHDLNELMAEQEHIIDQMRQTSYWDEGMEQMQEDLGAQWAAYREKRQLRHPSR